MDDRTAMPWHPLEWDVNNDGGFTVSDVGLWLHHLFFLPGDLLIWGALRYAPGFSSFLEVNASHFGSTIAALLSVFVWLAFGVFLLTTSHWFAVADRALTQFIRGGLTRCYTRILIISRLTKEFSQRKRKQILKLFQRTDNRPKLNAEELRVLKAHAHVERMSALALSDLVRATGVPRMQVVEILDNLRELRLLDRHVDPEKNESGSTLTDPGRDFLAAGQ